MEKEVARISAENDWDSYRRKAGIGTYSLAGLIFILPKIGPLKLASVKGPTQTTETEYIHSVPNLLPGSAPSPGAFHPTPHHPAHRRQRRSRRPQLRSTPHRRAPSPKILQP